jgi:predicted phosphohydrolase
MKFQVISDIHIEMMDDPILSFRKGELWVPCANNLIICGNIGEARNDTYFLFLDEIRKHYKRVFVVPGIQEFFFSDIETILTKIQNYCEYALNVYFLNDTLYDFGKVVILGCTLWANVDLSKHPHLSTKYQHINKGQSSLTCNDTVSMHKSSVKLLKSSLNLIDQTEKKVIVCTHYPPLVSGVSNPKLEIETKNIGDATDLSKFMKYQCIKSWVFGHTHWHVDSTVNNVKIISNPIGYKTEKLYYSPVLTITI